jgi:hypothetical protein
MLVAAERALGTLEVAPDRLRRREVVFGRKAHQVTRHVPVRRAARRRLGHGAVEGDCKAACGPTHAALAGVAWRARWAVESRR